MDGTGADPGVLTTSALLVGTLGVSILEGSASFAFLIGSTLCSVLPLSSTAACVSVSNKAVMLCMS